MKFKNLKELQKHMEDIAPAILGTDHVKNVLADQMSESVHEVVYKAYKPEQYPRKKNDGGLSDKRNMHWTVAKTLGNVVYMRFENLRMGQTHYLPIYDYPIDSLDDLYITDVIEEGATLEGDWYYDGPWSKPRPFVRDAIFHLRGGTKLVNGIKAAFRDDGYKVK